MKKVVIGLLGPVLDHGFRQTRWEKWRPTVGMCQQEGLHFDRVELLHAVRYHDLATVIAADIRQVSLGTEANLREVEVTNPWDFEEMFGALYDFASSYKFDPENEEYYVHITTGTHVAQICLFLLTESRHFPAKLIQTNPPKNRERDGIAGVHSIIDLDLSRYDKLTARFAIAAQDDIAYLKSGITTHNPQFNRQIELIERVALRSAEPILLMGPTGSGKSQLAKRLFELKRTRSLVSGRFVEVNCATLRGDTALSTLFGHKKGAFTGAAQDREGLLRSADQGVLFLDEVGELGLDEQAMLLRAIEEKRFFPVGSDREVASSFQLICGTNRDLEQAVQFGRFREDLLARIKLWTFRLPGLQARPEDIEPNLDYELEQFVRKGNRRVTFSAEARKRFLAFAKSADGIWAANFRDLNSAVIRMATLADGGRITDAVVDEEIERLRSHWNRSVAVADDAKVADCAGGDVDAGKIAVLLALAGEIDEFDRLQLRGVLAVCLRAKTVSEAGRILFAVTRNRRKAANDADRLRKYLARFNLSWRDIVG